MKKLGFTLIELLAVIVILAIIALITTPLITGIVGKAKKGGAESSALGWIDAVGKNVMAILVQEPDAVQELNSLSGRYSVSDLPGLANVKGQKPDDGWVEFEKGQIVDYSLVYGDYRVTPKDGNPSKAVAIKKDSFIPAVVYRNNNKITFKGMSIKEDKLSYYTLVVHHLKTEASDEFNEDIRSYATLDECNSEKATKISEYEDAELICEKTSYKGIKDDYVEDYNDLNTKSFLKHNVNTTTGLIESTEVCVYNEKFTTNGSHLLCLNEDNSNRTNVTKMYDYFKIEFEDGSDWKNHSEYSNVSTDGCSNLAMNDSTDCAITNGYNNNDPNDIVVAVAYQKSYEFPYIATGSIRGNQFIGNHYGAKYKCYIIDGQALCE